MRIASRYKSPVVRILRYHSVTDNSAANEDWINTGITHTMDTFKKEMTYLSENYDLITIEDIFLYLNHYKDIKKRSVAVTFDDGFSDNFTQALPILERLGIKATFYIAASFIETDCAPWYCRLWHAFKTTKKPVWKDSYENCERPLKSPSDMLGAISIASRRCGLLSGGAQISAVEQIEKDLDISKKKQKI